MSLVLSKTFATNGAQERAMVKQKQVIQNERMFNLNSQGWQGAFHPDQNHDLSANSFFKMLDDGVSSYYKDAFKANAGLNPRDLFREFDPTTVRERRLDEGRNILYRLMPQSRSLPIGRTIFSFARSSGQGEFQTSMDGDVNIIYDNTDYDTDQTLIPLHQNGFKRQWREQNQLSQEAFDDAAVQQEEGIRRHEIGLVGYLLDGTNLVHNGASWNGFRNDTRVDQIDLSQGTFQFDFTASGTTGEDYFAAWLRLDQRRVVANRVTMPATWFVSYQVWYRMMEDYSDDKGDNTIYERCMKAPSVMEIIPTDALTGNQILSMPTGTSAYVQPLVGMGMSTIALPRQFYRDPYEFEVASALGLMVKNDFEGTNRGVQYASS